MTEPILMTEKLKQEWDKLLPQGAFEKFNNIHCLDLLDNNTSDNNWMQKECMSKTKAEAEKYLIDMIVERTIDQLQEDHHSYTLEDLKYFKLSIVDINSQYKTADGIKEIQDKYHT